MRCSKKKLVLSLCCFVFSIASAQQTTTIPKERFNADSLKKEFAKQKRATAKKMAKVQLRSMIINAGDGTFGYYIFADGQMLIEQKTIPGLSGNQGFISKEEAKRTAAFVIKKLRSGEMPPTVNVKDLKTLKITATYPKE